MRKKIKASAAKRDQKFLLSMILYSTEELTDRGTPITREAIQDYLFSEARHDPEARDLEARVEKVLVTLGVDSCAAETTAIKGEHKRESRLDR